MIDLRGTFIKNKEGELRDLWVAECEKQGFNLYNTHTLAITREFLEVFDGKIYATDDVEIDAREITLEDLKLKSTKTEFVKVEMKDAHKYHTNELFFEYSSEKIDPLKEVDAAFFIINQHKLVRKVDREVTWQDEVNEILDNCTNSENEKAILKEDGLYMDAFLPLDAIIEISHLIASRTDKSE